jgi:hypothetical protein
MNTKFLIIGMAAAFMLCVLSAIAVETSGDATSPSTRALGSQAADGNEIPEPTSAFIGAVGLFILLRRRR